MLMLYFYEDVKKGKDNIKLYCVDGTYTVDYIVYTMDKSKPEVWGLYHYTNLAEADDKFRDVFAKYFITKILHFPPPDGTPRPSAFDVLKRLIARLKRNKIRDERTKKNNQLLARTYPDKK